MASVKDTATFFTEGTASQFQHVLSLYPQVLRLKAESKKKPEDLVKLDSWWVALVSLHEYMALYVSLNLTLFRWY